MSFGITAQGFVPKTLQDILASLRAKQRATVDPNWSASDETLEGQLNGSFAAEHAEVWGILDFLVNQYNPDAAEGVELDMLSALTATLRLGNTKGTVVINLQSSGATTWPAGTLVAQDADPTNVWVLSTAVVAGAPGTFPGNFVAQNPGHIEAPSGSLTVKVSSVASWVGATNPLDASPGRNIETTEELRIRREEELRALGGSSEPAVTEDIEQLNPTAIKSVRVLSNETDAVDANGLPPHSFEAIIWDPAPDGPVDDDLIAQRIWDSKALGIQTNGFRFGTAITKAGEHKTMFFTRVEESIIFFGLDVVIDPSFYPTDGDDQVKAALKKEAEKLLPGGTVYFLKFRAAALNITGVIDAPQLRAGLNTPAVTEQNLLVNIRARGVLDTSNITVNHV